MREKIDGDKLRIVVRHWIGHNRAHIDEFETWAERATAVGHDAVAQELRGAVKLLAQVEQRLERAGRILEDD